VCFVSGRCTRWMSWSHCLWYMWTLLASLLTLLRRLCIPLVQIETWNQPFAMMAPPISVLVWFFLCIDHNDPTPPRAPSLDWNPPSQHIWRWLALSIFGGSGFIYRTSSPSCPPQGWAVGPYVALAIIMCVVWIMHIAQEVYPSIYIYI
jgi:hypothetical protein